MKKQNSVWLTVKNGCVTFTVITVLSYIAGTLLSFENKAFIPTLKWILLFLVFSVLLAFANLLLKSETTSVGAKLSLHFLASAMLYFITVVLCGGFIESGAQTLIAMTFFVIIYLIFAVIFAISASGSKRKKNRTQKYDSMFK